MPRQSKRSPSAKVTPTLARPEASNQLTRLNKEQQQNPTEVLEAFFDTYHLRDVHECLWDWLYAALASDYGNYQTGKERSNLMFFFENIGAMAEAAFLLHQKNTGSRITIKSNKPKKAAAGKKGKKQ